VVNLSGQAEGAVARVSVLDHGPGIPERHRSRIFTKFFRGGAPAGGVAGAGLGLAIAREIVEAHGGRIGFTTAEGEGSTFWFELPLVAEGEPTALGAAPQ
jgi:signal transduction histidine kinase